MLFPCHFFGRRPGSFNNTIINMLIHRANIKVILTLMKIYETCLPTAPQVTSLKFKYGICMFKFLTGSIKACLLLYGKVYKYNYKYAL